MTDMDPTAWTWLASPPKKHKLKDKVNSIQNWTSKQLTKRFGFGPLAIRTLKNFGFNSAANLISRVGAILFTIIVARLLRPEGYGNYALALSVVAICLTFIDVGINAAMVRYTASALGKNNSAEARSYFRYLFKFKFLLAGIVAVTLAFMAKPLALYLFQKPDIVLPLQIAAAFVFAQAILSYLEAAFHPYHEFKYLTLSKGAWQGLKLAAAPLFITLGFSVSGVFLGLLLATTCVIFLVGWLLYKKHRALVNGPIIKINKARALKFFGWISVSSASGVIFTYIDTLMIGAMLPAAQVGYYRAASMIIFAIIGATSASTVLFPAFTQLEKNKLYPLTQKAIKYLLVLAIPIAIALILFAKWAILILYGSEYLPAKMSLIILAPIIVFSVYETVLSILFASKERVDVNAKIIMAAMALNVLLNYFFIKWWGITGAATATLSSRFLVAATFLFLARRFFTSRNSTNH